MTNSIKMENLVKPKNSLKLHFEICKIKKEVSRFLDEIPDLQKIRNDPELLKMIIGKARVILSSKLKDDVDINTIVFDVFCQFFPNMNDNEKDLIKKNIEYLTNNDQIKNVSCFKKNKKKVIDFFLKK